MIAANPSGLTSSTTYYFKVNGTEYSIVTTSAPTYQQVADLMHEAISSNGFTAVIAGYSPDQDIRVINNIRGWGSRVRLEHGVSGNDLFGSLANFTNFDSPVDSGGAADSFLLYYAGSGYINFTGASDYILDEVFFGCVGSGYIGISGSSAYYLEYLYEPSSGSMSASGSAPYEIYTSPEYEATGLISIAESSSLIGYEIVRVGSGSANFFGASTYQDFGLGWEVVAEGSIASSGSSEHEAYVSAEYAAAGLATSTGSAATSLNILLSYSGSGSIGTFGGSAYMIIYLVIPFGGIVFAGAANTTVEYIRAGSGALSMNGEGSYETYTAHYANYSTSGSTVVSGSSIIEIHFEYDGSGVAFVFGGAAIAFGPLSYGGSGSVSTSGSAETTHSRKWGYSTSGSASTLGSADCEKYSAYYDNYDGNGTAFTFGGAAIAFGPLSYGGSGSVIFDGSATCVLYSKHYVKSGSGSMALGGAPTYANKRIPANMLHLYTSAGDVISGATRASTYDGKFPMLTTVSGDVGTTGGVTNHGGSGHGAASTSTSGSVSNPLTAEYQTFLASGYTASASSHTHTMGHTHSDSIADNNLPEYEDVLAYYDSAVGTNSKFLFVGANIPDGWSEYSSNSGKYLRFNSAAGTGGNFTHSHAYTGNSGTTGGAAANTSYLRSYYFYSHYHVINHSHSATLYPSYVLARYIYKTSIIRDIDEFPSGVVAFFTSSTLPSGWTAYSSPGEKLVRHDTVNPGTTGGTSVHNHASESFTTTSRTNVTTYECNTGADGRRIGTTEHTYAHGHTTDVSHMPPWVKLYAAKKD